MPEYTVNGGPLASVVMFRNCQPSVTYFPSGCRNPTLPSGKSSIRLNENTCVTSNTDAAFSARVSSGFCGRVCKITPAFVDTPSRSALASSIDFEYV